MGKRDLVEVVDERKVKMMERWYADSSLEVVAAIWQRVREGKITWEQVWKTAMPAVRANKREGGLAAKYAMQRYIAKNRQILSQLFEQHGLGIDKVIEKTAELLEAYKLDVHKGQVTIDPETGERLKIPDNIARLRALDMLLELHGYKKAESGGQVLIYINAPQIAKPENAGQGFEVKVSKGGTKRLSK